VNRFALPLVGFALLVAVLIVGLKHAPDKGIISSPLIGNPAPQFTLPNLLDTKSTIGSSMLKGRWTLLNVWGTWCVECRAEHAALLEIKHEGRVPIIGIDWKDDDAQALAWLGELGNPYERIGADRDGRVAIVWGVYGAPETFLIDPTGKVVYKHIGALSADIWRDEFLPLLGAPLGRGS
jgi:cytochrome c biogenesis protein CcmG/thiol:disulfide interchange protein DsbE